MNRTDDLGRDICTNCRALLNESLSSPESDFIRNVKRAALQRAMHYGTRYIVALEDVVLKVWFDRFGRLSSEDAMALVAMDTEFATYYCKMKAAGLEP